MIGSVAIYHNKLYIGTSNIVLPGNKTTFPPEFHNASRLNYYAHFLKSQEINKSFYKIPRYATFQKWAQDVPADFRFSVKITRTVTHEKNLAFDPAAITTFIEATEGLGMKKGCMLIQFPGKITLDYFSAIEKILREIKQHGIKHEWRKAIEFRHPSWYIRETTELLHEYQATQVMHDMPKVKNSEWVSDSHFLYIRLHGPAGDYRGSYSKAFLESKAELIKTWLMEGKEVFVYFNNTMGSAFENACSFRRILHAQMDKQTVA